MQEGILYKRLLGQEFAYFGVGGMTFITAYPKCRMFPYYRQYMGLVSLIRKSLASKDVQK